MVWAVYGSSYTAAVVTVRKERTEPCEWCGWDGSEVTPHWVEDVYDPGTKTYLPDREWLLCHQCVTVVDHLIAKRNQ